RLEHRYGVRAATVATLDAEHAPVARYPGRQDQSVSLEPAPENHLQTHPAPPARMPVVPSPAAAPELSLRGIDVCSHHVRLHLVSVHFLRRAAVRERVDHLVQLESAIAVAVHGDGKQGPERRVRVLRAILAHARQVTLDVAGV